MHAPSSRIMAARERRAATHAVPPTRRETHHTWQQQRLQQRHPMTRACAGRQEHARA